MSEERSAEATTVGGVMTRLVIAVRPQDPVQVAIERVLDEKIGAVPVLDEDGHPVGFLSQTDLLRAAALGVELEAGELMTGAVMSVREDAKLAFAATLMARHGLHRLIVVDAEHRAVGMLSSLDVLRWMAEEEGYLAQIELGS